MIYLLVAEEQRFFDPERPFAALRANRSDRPFADSLSVKPMGLSTRYQYERGREAGGQLPERGLLTAILLSLM